MSDAANTLRAMQAAVENARMRLLDEITVERIQRAAGGHIRSDETVSAALREVDAVLKEMQRTYGDEYARQRRIDLDRVPASEVCGCTVEKGRGSTCSTHHVWPPKSPTTA